VNTQRTVSPGSTTKLATPVAVSPLLSLSSHTMLVSTQPAGTVSVEE
jgi:hypothetical protein